MQVKWVHVKRGQPNLTRISLFGLISDQAGQYGIDHLLLVETGGMGFERPFSAYVPTAEPRAWVAGSVTMIKLPENRLEWYEPVQIRKSADGAWDEPPSFPGLTSAYYQAIEEFKDRVLVDLKK